MPTGPGDLDEDDGDGGSGVGSTSSSGTGLFGSSGEGGAGVGGDGTGNTGSGTGGGGTAGGGTGGSGQGGWGDPNCYTEPVDPQADISDIVQSYGGSGYRDQVIEAMNRRWPAGGHLLTVQKNDYYFGQFSDPYSWSGMVGWLDTLVHEETHLINADLAWSQGQAHALYFRSDLIIYLPAEQGFPRSEILDDLVPALQNSIYAMYFTGQQGQRAFNPLLDEATCYGNEVPGMAVFGEYYNGGVSLRDGSAAFLNFIQVYLRVARNEYPTFYNFAKGQPAYVDAVRTIWLRTHFHYQHADTHPSLGINDATYRAEAHQQHNLDEIEMFIGAKVGDSNCLITQ